MAGLHTWVAAGWIVGALLAPPLEAVAYSVLVPVALIRFRSFLRMLADRPHLRFVLVSYALLLSWAFISLAWAPEGMHGKVYARAMIAPFLVVHSGLTSPVIARALYWPGAIWAVVLVTAFLGLPGAAAIQPEHPSRAALGLVMLGCVAFSGAVEDPSVRSWLKCLPELAVWFGGAALAGSRSSVVAVLGGTLVSAVLTRGTAWVTITAVFAAAAALSWTPLGDKIAAQMAPQVESSVVTVALADKLDAMLSSRVGLWDWTLTSCSHVIVGHGALSWPHDLRAAIAGGAPRVTLVTKLDPAAGALTHAHCVMLQVLYEQGLVGVALLIGFMVALGDFAWRSRNAASGRLLIAVAAALAIQSFAEGALLSRASATALSILIALCSVDSATPKLR